MKDHRHLGTKTGKFRVKKWLLFFIHKNLPESIGIFYGVVAAVTDVFFDRVGTVAGGKALADLVLADGTKVAGATIASVDNAVTTNYNSGVVEVLTAEGADDYTNNNAYYNRIFTYSVNADGSYDLLSIATPRM